MTEMTAAGKLTAHPSDLVAAIYGSNNVTLSGFGAEAMPHSWVRPGLRFVSVHDSVAAAVLNRSQTLRWIRGAIALLLLVCGISLGLWFGAYTPQEVDKSLGAWSVLDITTEGVTIRQSNTSVLIKPGALLPNGEKLVSTAPPQRAYITDKATTIINADTGVSK